MKTIGYIIVDSHDNRPDAHESNDVFKEVDAGSWLSRYDDSWEEDEGYYLQAVKEGDIENPNFCSPFK